MTNKDQLSQKTLDEVIAVVKKLGPETLAAQFQDVALELAKQQRSLEKETATFNQECRQREADLEEQSSELAESWLRLETERRNLQMNQANNQAPTTQATVDPVVSSQPIAREQPVLVDQPISQTPAQSLPQTPLQPASQTPAPFQSVVPQASYTPHNDQNSAGPSLIEQFQLLAAGKNSNQS